MNHLQNIFLGKKALLAIFLAWGTKEVLNYLKPWAKQAAIDLYEKIKKK